MFVKYVLGMQTYLIQMHALVLLHLNSHEIHVYLGLKDVNLFHKVHITKIFEKVYKYFWIKKLSSKFLLHHHV
jgi:hypothetical protein